MRRYFFSFVFESAPINIRNAIFFCCFRFLKEHALDTINVQGLEMDEMDIHWVITVPAIWTDGAKQFMREAAQKVSA